MRRAENATPATPAVASLAVAAGWAVPDVAAPGPVRLRVGGVVSRVTGAALEVAVLPAASTTWTRTS